MKIKVLQQQPPATKPELEVGFVLIEEDGDVFIETDVPAQPGYADNRSRVGCFRVVNGKINLMLFINSLPAELFHLNDNAEIQTV